MPDLPNKDLSLLSFTYLYNTQAFSFYYTVKQIYVTLRKILVQTWKVGKHDILNYH